MHWVHMSGIQSYRHAIAAHYRARTAGEQPNYRSYVVWGKKDHWWDVYAGRIYVDTWFDTADGVGIEVPARYAQLLRSPVTLAKQTDVRYNRHAGYFLETLKVVLRIFTGEYK